VRKGISCKQRTDDQEFFKAPHASKFHPSVFFLFNPKERRDRETALRCIGIGKTTVVSRVC